MDYPIILAVVILFLVGLVVLINIRNKKDKRDLERTLNNDFKKPRDEEGEPEIDLKSD